MLHLRQIGGMKSIRPSVCDAGAGRRVVLAALLVVVLLAATWLAVV